MDSHIFIVCSGAFKAIFYYRTVTHNFLAAIIYESLENRPDTILYQAKAVRFAHAHPCYGLRFPGAGTRTSAGCSVNCWPYGGDGHNACMCALFWRAQYNRLVSVHNSCRGADFAPDVFVFSPAAGRRHLPISMGWRQFAEGINPYAAAPSMSLPVCPFRRSLPDQSFRVRHHLSAVGPGDFAARESHWEATFSP